MFVVAPLLNPNLPVGYRGILNIACGCGIFTKNAGGDDGSPSIRSIANEERSHGQQDNDQELLEVRNATEYGYD